MTLGSAGNTQGPALHILEVIKQYTVMYICGDDYDDEEPVLSQWVAVKEEKSFFAESPEALLGLVCIYEALGNDWNKYSAYDTEHIFQRDPSYLL